MKKFFLLFILLPLLTVSFQAYSQCTSCTFTAPSGGTSFNLNGNQTLCITANTGDLSININGSNNKICVATGVTWTQTSGLNLGGTTIDVYGTANLNGSFTVNSAAFINVKPGAIANTNSTGFGNNLTINNEGTFNYTSTSGISHQGSFVFNNIGVSSILNATANTLFVIGNGSTFTNAGTMNFKSLENSDALLLENKVGGIIKIGGTFFNHGKIYNAGTVETVCGLFGSVACEFIVGDKGPDVFTTAPGGCFKIGGNATFNGPITLNSGLEVAKDLTINKPISGTNGSIKVLAGVSTITSSGNFTGTNLKFYDVNTAGNGFDANNGNIASNFTVSSAAGCSVACTTPVVAITGTNNLTCSTTSVTRTASGGGTYVWSNSLGTNATATMTAAGTYTVTVTATGGCTATATTVVTANRTPPTAGVSGNTNLSCVNTSVTRTATGGGTYLWSNGLGTNATVNISAAGIYTVTVTSANGCTATATTSVITENALTWSGTYGNYSGYCSSNYLGTANNTFSSTITIPSTTSSVKFTFKFGTHGYSSNTSYIRIETGTGTVLATYFPVSGDIVDNNGGCLQARELTATNPAGNTSLKIVVYGDDNWAKLEPTCFSICNLTATVNVTQPACGQTTGSISVTAPSGASSFQYKNGISGTWQSGTTFNSLTAGNYSIYIRDANNTSCEKLLGTYAINTPPVIPTASITGVNNLTCTTTSVSRTASGGGSYSWSNGLGTNASVNITSAGTYTVTVTNANGCTATATTSVTINNSVPTAGITGTTNLTCSTTSVSRTASGGGSYSWSNGLGTNASVNITSAGTYTVTVTNANGCSATATTAVTIDNSVPTAGITGTTNLTCTTTSVSRTATGGGSYSWSNGLGTNASVNITSAGTYTVTVTNANGCTATATTAVTIDNSVPTAGITGTNNLTCTTTSVSRTATSGGSYSWSNGLGTNASVNITSAGTYTVTVTNTNGCTATATTAVTINNTVPTAGITGTTNLTCTTTSVSRTASGGGSYSWSNGLGTNASVNITSAGTYTVTVTNANGCSATATTSVTIDNTVPTAGITGTTNLTCTTTSVSRTASGGGSYSWSNGLGTNASVNITSAGTYTVTVTNANGCSATATTSVTIDNSVPTASITGTTNLTCTTTSVSRTASGGGSYSWSNGLGTNASVNITSAGTYTVTVTNANGCIATATTSVTIDNSVPTAGITGTNNLTCTTTSVSRTASGGGSYLWSNGLGTNASVNITSAGTYTVTVTNVNGCSATATTSVTINNSVPTASITGTTNLTCTTTSVSRTASGGGSYLWSNGLGTNASVNITSVGTYTVTVTNANGCTATATTSVTIDNSVPTAGITGTTNLTCTTTSVSRTASGGGTYSWSNGLGTNASVNITSAGTYTVTVTNANGCTATATTSVTIDNSVPTVSITGTTNLTCTTTSVSRTASGGGSYSWSNGLGTNASVNITSAGTYTVTVTNANGCSATATTSVTIDNSVPTAGITGTTNLTCTTTSVSRTASGGGSYSWSNGLGTNASVNITSAGTYTVTVTNANGCSATATTSVTIDNSVPTASITGTTNLTCTTTSVSRTASGGGSYSWSNGLGTNASVSISVAGTYTVTVIATNGCTATATTTVTSDSTVPQPTTASAEKCGEGILTLSASGCAGTYNWYSSSSSNSSLATTASFITPVISTTTLYYVSCTVGSCTSSRSVATATINEIPTNVTASSNSPIKEGNSLNLVSTSTAGTNYSWTGPNNFTSTLQNPSINSSTELMEGIYTVTVSSPKGCTATATTNVIVFNLPNLPDCTGQVQPTVTANSNSPIISGGTINLSSTATGAIDYLWAGPNGFTSSLQNPSITNSIPSMAGIYTVAVTVDGICKVTATTNVIITCLENPVVSSNTPICVGNSLNLSASGGNSYSWTGPNNFTSTQQNPTILNAQTNVQGVYTVTLTGVNCTTTVTTNVVVNPLPNAEAGIDKVINCTTASVELGSDAVIPNATYLWSPSTGLSATNSSIVTATPTTTTTYILTVTNNQTGCTATDAVVVTVDKSVPTAEAGIDKVINCTTTSVELGSDAVIPNATYLWSPSTGLSATNSSIVTATPTTTTTYILTVTNNQTGCTATDVVVVTVDKSVPTMSISASESTLTCAVTQTTLTANVTPAGTYTYQWSNGGITSSTVVYNPGTITLAVTAANGCVTTATTVITSNVVPPTASIAGTDNLTCTASSVTRVASGGGTYLWSNNLGTSATATISAAGTYTVTVTAANGCTATATTSVTVDTGVPTVVINATEDTLTCLKTQSVLTAEITPSGTYTYLWSNGSTASSINVNDAGTYSVEVTAANGCKASASVLIREFNTVTAQVDVKDVDCKSGNNGKITVTGFDGIAPYKFKLNTGSFQSNNVFDGLTAGTYAVAIQDAGGCTASISITVKEPLTSVALTVTPTNLKCNGATDGQIQATATGGTPDYTFAINGGTAQSNSLFTNLVAGVYTITATDTKGCSTTATTEITQPQALVIAAIGSTIDCSTPKGTITATVTGGTPAYQFSIDGTNFQPSNSFANLNGGTYTITVKDLNLCVGTITAAITVADTVKPTFTSAVATMATCTAGNANNDGKLTITGVVNGVKYQYSAGSTFNTSTAVPAVAAAIPSNGVLSSTLSNPTANSQFYTIRIFNNNGCYKDVTVELLKRVCDCKTDICVPVLINKTKTRSK